MTKADWFLQKQSKYFQLFMNWINCFWSPCFWRIYFLCQRNPGFWSSFLKTKPLKNNTEPPNNLDFPLKWMSLWYLCATATHDKLLILRWARQEPILQILLGWKRWSVHHRHWRWLLASKGGCTGYKSWWTQAATLKDFLSPFLSVPRAGLTFE